MLNIHQIIKFVRKNLICYSIFFFNLKAIYNRIIPEHIIIIPNIFFSSMDMNIPYRVIKTEVIAIKFIVVEFSFIEYLFKFLLFIKSKMINLIKDLKRSKYFFNINKYSMKKNIYILKLILISFYIFSCQSNIKKISSNENWYKIWNGNNLDGWNTYLETPYSLKKDSLDNKIIPFGINNDPLEVVKIVEMENGNAIRISGVAWGMIFTENDYEDYHLKLKVKWGEKMHSPRENGPRDSGLLYHGFGPPGISSPWMDSQELQIQEGDIGDYWPIGDVEINIPSVSYKEPYYIYNKDGEIRNYYYAEILNKDQHDSMAKRRVYKSFDAEKAHGEWNNIELIVLSDRAIHIVNGKVVMRLYNSKKKSDKSRLTSGKIMLQSEGAEVYYKDIYIKKINNIPAEYK